MKRKNQITRLLTIVAIIILIGIPIGLTHSHNSSSNKTLTKNYGVSNVTSNIDVNGTNSADIDIDSIVPTAEKLIENLEKKGYEVNHFDTVGELDIMVNRIYAKKDNYFLDICYNVSKSDAGAIFAQYEDSYHSYYIMAQNDCYVYCISDKKTFKHAGFNSLANVGTQYIYD